MDLKAASILVYLFLTVSNLSAFAVEKDWASIVLSLKPKQGQNFEQDLQLSKALFSLERRIEAIRVLEDYVDNGDDRARKQLNLISTQFYNQETANSYYEAIRLIGTFKWPEAHDRLESALAKEPGHEWVITRLIQTEIMLKQKDAALEHLKLAESLNFESKELKLFAARAAIDFTELKDQVRVLTKYTANKSLFLNHPVTVVWWLDLLLKLKRNPDLLGLESRVLKEHRLNSFALAWMLLNVPHINAKEKKAIKTQLDKNLKDRAKFDQELDADSKRTQYLWVGYFSYDSLKEMIAKSELPVPESSAESPSEN